MNTSIDQPDKEDDKRERPRVAADANAPFASQAALFDRAIRLFQQGKFAEARTLFLAANGPALPIAHAARLHVRMCDQRLSKPQVSLATADEHYDYAVALINERRLSEAEEHLREAIAKSPRGDHLYYALALCRGLSGDLDGSYTYLKHAVTLLPRNRALARNDPDFADIGHQSPLRELLYPEECPLDHHRL